MCFDRHYPASSQFSFFFEQEIPQQMNGSDCGMFTCKYADYITKDKPITFTQVILSVKLLDVFVASKCNNLFLFYFFYFYLF